MSKHTYHLATPLMSKLKETIFTPVLPVVGGTVITQMHSEAFVGTSVKLLSVPFFAFKLAPHSMKKSELFKF